MKLASIETVQAVTKHPNADSLDLVQVLGFQCITKLGAFEVGDDVVFIQPDTILPVDRPWAQDLLRYTSKGRVRTQKLRGEWSTGIVLKDTDVFGEIDYFLSPGQEIADQIGVTKYEPPLPQDAKAKGGLPFGIPKTDEERWENLREVPYGETVDVTLKIDGSSFTAYCCLPEHSGLPEVVTGVCSRSLELKNDPELTNTWLAAERKYGVLERLTRFCQDRGVFLALRGEVYGGGVQSSPHNPHSKLPLDVAFYSVWNIGARRYEGTWSDLYFSLACFKMDLPWVPFLERDVSLGEDTIKTFQDAKCGKDGLPFEGVVIKGKNFSFKVINRWYDSKKE